jgi:hypothetical protein
MCNPQGHCSTQDKILNKPTIEIQINNAHFNDVKIEGIMNNMQL